MSVAGELRRTGDQAALKRIGQYEPILQIGAGAAARVYLALHRGLPKQKAELAVVKILRSEVVDDENVRTLFMDEARIAMRLQHPNIVRTREVIAEPPDYLLAMDFQNGQSLLDVLQRLGREAVPLDEHIFILSKVLTGLSYAHQLKDENGRPFGIVHRDVSPANVLVAYTGEVKLLDFGIAKATGALTQTRDGVVKGKLGYAAPEQCLGQPADPRSDIYAVGVMLWEAIAGRRRASGETWQSVLQARLDHAEPDLDEVCPDAPEALVAIVRKALAPEPRDRYAAARDFENDLKKYLNRRGAAIGPARVAAMLKPHFDRDRAELQQAVEAFVNARKGDSGDKGETARRIPLPTRGAAPPPVSAASPAASLATVASATASSATEARAPTPPVAVARARAVKVPTAQARPAPAPVPPVPARAAVAPPLPARRPVAGTPAKAAPVVEEEHTADIPVDTALLMMSRAPGEKAPDSASSTPTAPPPAASAGSSADVASTALQDDDDDEMATRRPPPNLETSSSARERAAPVSPLATDAYGIVVVSTPVPHTLANIVDAPPAKRKTPVLPFLLLSAGAMALGAFVFVSMHDSAKARAAVAPEPVATGASMVTAQPAPAPKVETVKVRISVDPPDAAVKLDGHILSSSPIVTTFPKDSAAHELLVFAEGCRDVTRVVHLNQDLDVLVGLKCLEQSARKAVKSAAARAAKLAVPPAAAIASAAPAPVVAPLPPAIESAKAPDVAPGEAMPTPQPPVQHSIDADYTAK
jgi:serine/threonine-protein kinase